MGKRGGWFSAVKRALYSESSQKKDKKQYRSKRKWFGKSSRGASDPVLTPGDVETLPAASPLQQPLPPPVENHNLAQVEEEQSKHAYSVALATAVAAEAAVAAAQAAAEVVRLTSAAGYSGNSKEEIAAIKIQTVFRGYMARRALRALRGLVRLKTFIGGQSVKRQAASSLRCMQTISRMQSQVRARRIWMSEENQAILRQFQHKQEKQVEKLSLAGSWNVSAHSKEQMEANFLSKQEAAIRRERALAYAFSHQKTWKKSNSVNPMFMDPNNPQWGWSWLERWTLSQPWEAKPTTTPSKAYDRASRKSDGLTSLTSAGEISRSNSSRHNLKKPSSIASKPTRARSQHYSPSTPTSNDSRSMFSVQSEMMVRRHSITGSFSVREDESLMSTPAIPSYMAPTMSAKAKSRVPIPLRFFHDDGTPTMQAGKPWVGSARKRLSFPSSPGSGLGTRRLSGPSKVDSSNIITKGLVM
ncbi:hypothetical protein MLD38_009793 [Melastoma candidum]|uniref:Uncharacterized protein n=1 Tax=Melastoma candidum TaxID=119954 RepID=A0ACB9S1R3_9MYRT|nr:hypothetical protein MLD38_009793 [Melastoma candidum]